MGLIIERLWWAFILLFFMGNQAVASSGITYQGRLLAPNSVPVTSNNVQFKMQIRTPGIEDCLLYEEIQTVDLSATSGVFAISLADGTGTRTDGHVADWTLFEALSNRQDFSFDASDCTGPTSYSPDPTDNRRFRVFFDLGSGWESLPTQTINYIPMSIETYAVGGFPASSLFRVEDAGVLGNVAALTTTQYNNLVSLANGSSGVYEKAGELGGSVLPSLSNGQTFVSDGSGGWTASTPFTTESDPTVSAFAKASLPTCDPGEVLRSDGSVLSCVTDTSGTLPDVGTAGTYTKVTTDAKGRVTSGDDLEESDLPDISTAGKVSGDAITDGEIGGSASINTSGSIVTTGNIQTTKDITSRRLVLFDHLGAGPDSVTLQAPGDMAGSGGGAYALTLPEKKGSAGQVLAAKDNTGTLEWISPSTGSVTSVTGTSPIVVGGSASAPEISLANSGVGVGTYGSTTQVPVITVDSKGRITSASNTMISGVSPVGSDLSTGMVWVGDSGKAQEKFINISDVRSTALGNAPVFPLSCTNAEILVWKSPQDVFDCAEISINSDQVAGLDDALDEKVAKAGDTMTGVLNLPTDGLTVGNNQLIVKNGNVGIGTTVFGDAKLVATGLMRSFVANNHIAIEATDGSAGYGSRLRFGGAGTAANILQIQGVSDIPVLTISGGSVGIGTTNPTAHLHLKAGAAAAGSAPLKLTSGTLLTTPESGAIEYDGTSLYYTDSGSTRRTLATASGGNFTEVNNISNSSGDITLAPQSTTGSVKITSGTTSTNSTTGALVVDGGVGVSGDIFSGGSINGTTVNGTTVNASSSLYTPQIYGSSAANGNIKIDGTSDATRGNVLLASAGGNVGIGTTNPSYKLHVASSDFSGTVGRFENSLPLTANQSGNFHGTWSTLLPNSSFDYTGSLYAAVNRIQTGVAQSGSIAGAVGADSDVYHYGSGTISNAKGLSAAVRNDSTGVISTASAVTASVTNTGGGTITNAYGVNIGSVAGTNKWSIYASDSTAPSYFAGSVGIGTTAPATKLHVSSSGSQASISVGNSDTGSSGGALMFSSNYSTLANPGKFTSVITGNPDNTTGGKLFFSTTQVTTGVMTERMRIDSSGNVGIGTTAPSGKLEVNGGNLVLANDAGMSMGLMFKPTDSTSSYDNTADERRFQWMTTGIDTSFGYKWSWRNADGSQRKDVLVFKKDGSVGFANQVGIGTINPISLFDVRSGGSWTSAGKANYAQAVFGGIEGALQVIGDDQGSHNASLILSGGDSKHWVMSHRGPVLSNRLSFGYQTNVAGSALDAGLAEMLTITTDGKVGIGTTAPSTKLDVIGTIKATAFEGPLTSTVVSAGSGSASAPSMNFSTDTNTGWFRPAEDTLAASTGGVEKMRIDSSGNVGIGTDNPQALLQVGDSDGVFFDANGNLSLGGYGLPTGPEKGIFASKVYDSSGLLRGTIRYTTPSGLPGIVFTNASGAGRADIRLLSTSGGLGLGANTTSGIPPVHLAIATDGSVGIGTTSPSSTLDVEGGVRAAPGTPVNDSANVGYTFGTNGDTGMFLANSTGAADGDIAFYSNSSQKMTILKSGNVGIGTVTPGNKLHISGTGTTGTWGSFSATSGGYLRIGESNNGLNLSLDGNSIVSDGGLAIVNTSIDSINLGTNNAIALTIADAGNVGIGTTAPSQKLEVNGNVLASGYLYTSDRRLKEDIQDIRGLENILKLHGVHFHWKKDGSPEYGLIAQEVEEVLPDLVVTDPKTGIKSVKYGNLVAPLVEAVKELSGNIDSLKHENKELKDKVSRLSASVSEIQKENALLKKAICKIDPDIEICRGH